MRRTSAWLTAAAIGLTLAGGTGVPAKTAAARTTRTRHTHPTTKTVTKSDQKK